MVSTRLRLRDVMYTISVLNPKGGVGKTVTAVNLAAALHQRGHPVFLVDWDAQMNATDWLAEDTARSRGNTIFKSLSTWQTAESPAGRLSQLIQQSASTGLSFVPSGPRMTTAQFDSALGRDPSFPHQFQGRLEELVAEPDHAAEPVLSAEKGSSAAGRPAYCLVDCPPALDRRVTMALVASDGVIIPIRPDRFSARSVNRLQETIHRIRRVHNPRLRILGLLPNNLDLRSGLVTQMRRQWDTVYGTALFNTAVLWRSKINESATEGTNLVRDQAESEAAGFYLDLATEVVERSRIATAMEAGEGRLQLCEPQGAH